MAAEAEEASGAGPFPDVEGGQREVMPRWGTKGGWRTNGGTFAVGAPIAGGDLDSMVVDEEAGVATGVELVVKEAEVGGGDGGEPGAADRADA